MQRRVIERAKRILYDDNVVHPVCIICPKINSRTFESKDERKLHRATEVYEKFFGKDYEKGMRAAVDRIVLNKYDPKAFAEMKEMQMSFDDKVIRHCCNHCRDCYRECTGSKNSARNEKMLDIIEKRRPLLFDFRINPFSTSHDMSRANLNFLDFLKDNPNLSPKFYDWSKEPPCESEDEISLD